MKEETLNNYLAKIKNHLLSEGYSLKQIQNFFMTPVINGVISAGLKTGKSALTIASKIQITWG